jgi:3-hydroxyacyl-[acyl-carrier-protein] dehydratase
MTLIEQLIPHRAPFLFVDRILSADEKHISAARVFGEGDFFFKGHFPAYPVVPGVILVEAMAQAGGAGLRKAGVLGEGALFFLASIEKAKFRRQVRPGDEVLMEIDNLRVSSRMIRQAGCLYAGGEAAAQAEWMCLVQGEGS